MNQIISSVFTFWPVSFIVVNYVVFVPTEDIDHCV